MTIFASTEIYWIAKFIDNREQDVFISNREVIGTVSYDSEKQGWDACAWHNKKKIVCQFSHKERELARTWVEGNSNILRVVLETDYDVLRKKLEKAKVLLQRAFWHVEANRPPSSENHHCGNPSDPCNCLCQDICNYDMFMQEVRALLSEEMPE